MSVAQSVRESPRRKIQILSNEKKTKLSSSSSKKIQLSGKKVVNKFLFYYVNLCMTMYIILSFFVYDYVNLYITVCEKI